MSAFSLSLRAIVSALVLGALCSGFAAAQSPAPNRGIIPESFRAKFFNGADLQGFFLELVPYPRPIAFHLECFGESAPYRGCELIPQLADGSDYSVSWSGQILAPTTGDYVFSLVDVDDGARLFIDGTEIVDQGWRWPDPDLRPSPQTVRIAAGSHQLRVDYEQRIFAAASLEVRWRGPGFADEIIPFARSSTPDAVSPRGGVSVMSLRPTFTWKDIAGAQRYILNIYHIRGTPPRLEQRVPPVILGRAEVNCGAGLCSFKPGLPRPGGDLRRFELSTLLAPPDDPLHQRPDRDESFIGYSWQVRAVVDGGFADGASGQFNVPKLGLWDVVRSGSSSATNPCRVHTYCADIPYQGGYWNLFDDSFYRWGEIFDVPPAVLKAIAYGESLTGIGPRKVRQEYFPPTRGYLYEPGRDFWSGQSCPDDCGGFLVPAYTPDPSPYDRDARGRSIKQFVSQVGFSFVPGLQSIPGCDPEDPDADLCHDNTKDPAQYGVFASYGLGQVLYYTVWPTLRNIALGELPPPVKLYEADFSVRAMASVLGMDKRCRAMKDSSDTEYPNASAPFERWARTVGKYQGSGKSYSDLVKTRLSVTQPDTSLGVQWELGRSGGMQVLLWHLTHLPSYCNTNDKAFQDQVKSYLSALGVAPVAASRALLFASADGGPVAIPVAAPGTTSPEGTEVSSTQADLKSDGAPVLVTLWLVGDPDLGKAGVIRIFRDESRQTLLWESPPVATNVLDSAQAVAVFNPAIGRVVVLTEWFEGFHSVRAYVVQWDSDHFALVPALDQDGAALDGVFSDLGGVFLSRDGALLAHRQNYLTHLQRIVDIYRFDGVAYRFERSIVVDEEVPDTAPPHTTATLSPALAGSGWNRVATTLRLTAMDEQEVLSISYVLANGAGSVAKTEYRSSVETGLGEGRWRVTFHASDASGNREPNQDLAVGVDLRPPRTKISLEGKPAGEDKFRGPVEVTLRAMDPQLQDTSPGSGVARIEYSLDNGAHWTVYSAPFSIAAPGRTLVSFRAIDVAGNVEPTQTESVVIGPVPPEGRHSACLDAGYDPASGLSTYVVQINNRVAHVNQCRDARRGHRRGEERDRDDDRDSDRDRDEKRDRDDDRDSDRDRDEKRDKDGARASDRDREERCGTCGAPGFYRLRPSGLTVLRTPKLPDDGRYRVRLLARAPDGAGRVTLRAGGQRFELEIRGSSWHWTAPVVLELERGSSVIRVQSVADDPVDVEALRIE